jgi:hypothetical protein
MAPCAQLFGDGEERQDIADGAKGDEKNLQPASACLSAPLRRFKIMLAYPAQPLKARKVRPWAPQVLRDLGAIPPNFGG